jgi:hypothetical protein
VDRPPDSVRWAVHFSQGSWVRGWGPPTDHRRHMPPDRRRPVGAKRQQNPLAPPPRLRPSSGTAAGLTRRRTRLLGCTARGPHSKTITRPSSRFLLVGLGLLRPGLSYVIGKAVVIPRRGLRLLSFLSGSRPTARRVPSGRAGPYGLRHLEFFPSGRLPFPGTGLLRNFSEKSGRLVSKQ